MQGHIENSPGSELPGSQLVDQDLARAKERRILKVDLNPDICVKFSYPAIHNPIDEQLKKNRNRTDSKSKT